MRTFKTIAAFFVGCGTIAGFAWLGGFSFDHRGAETVMIAALTMLCGITCAFQMWETTR